MGASRAWAGSAGASPRPTFSTFRNPVSTFIPVSRIADMLLSPGEPFQYDGHDLVYPDIRLVYWCGGNAFHQQQDLNRLISAWRRPGAVIVHEAWWTATARHADIVLPATVPLERNDIRASSLDRFIVAMKRAVAGAGRGIGRFPHFQPNRRADGLSRGFRRGPHRDGTSPSDL